MQSLAATLKKHPTPWTVGQEADGLIWIKDADGKDVDCDSDVDGNYGAYAEAVNIAAVAIELTRENRIILEKVGVIVQWLAKSPPPMFPLPPPVGSPRSALVDILADWMPQYEQWYRAHVRAMADATKAR